MGGAWKVKEVWGRRCKQGAGGGGTGGVSRGQWGRNGVQVGQEARHQRCTCRGVLWPLLSEGVTRRLRVEAAAMCWGRYMSVRRPASAQGGSRGPCAGGQRSRPSGTGLEVNPKRCVRGTESCQSAAFALAGHTDPQQDGGRLCAVQGEVQRRGAPQRKPSSLAEGESHAECALPHSPQVTHVAFCLCASMRTCMYTGMAV